MNISYEEIGQVLVTCPVAEGVTPGMAVKMGADGKMAPCEAGERLCGQAVSVAEDGVGGVQVKGFVTLDCADATVAPGWVELTGAGNGGVKKAAAGDKSASLLVMGNDGEHVVVCL